MLFKSEVTVKKSLILILFITVKNQGEISLACECRVGSPI